MLSTSLAHLCRRVGRARDQSGQAMLIVLSALALMATVPLVVISTTVNQLPLTTNNVNWNAAYEAAQAGLNDYIQQVDANPTYTQWNVNQTGCANNPPTNEAFCTWASSPSGTTALTTNPDEYYEYSVNTNGGKVTLTVSGKGGVGSRTVVRTFQYQMEPQATLDNIYWTNSEAGVTFVSSDTIYGPVFSNDDFNICGTPTFTDTVESANSEGLPGPPTTNYWQTSPGCGVATNPNFEDGVPTLAPNGAENMITNGTGPDSAPAQALGCQINGDSTFTLSGTQLSWTGGTLGTSGNPAGACGANAATGAGDGPITFASLKAPLFYVNGTITINGNATVDGFLTLVAASTATGNNDITIDGSITYPCTTPGHDITWTAGTCASPKGEGSDTQDALGLIASGNVNVSDNNAPTTINAAMIAINGSFKNAAAYITCPNYSGGGGPAGNPYNCPTLTIFGSIAQNTRGVVGHFDPSSGSIYQGYSKAYFYDTSLNTLWPPFFIPPANSTWTPRSYTELASGVANEAVPGT